VSCEVLKAVRSNCLYPILPRGIVGVFFVFLSIDESLAEMKEFEFLQIVQHILGVGQHGMSTVERIGLGDSRIKSHSWVLIESSYTSRLTQRPEIVAPRISSSDMV
jgi:hypothetical protein